MNTLPNLLQATPESVWAILQETAQLQKEFDKSLKKSREEFDRKMEESSIKAEKSRKEFVQSLKESQEKFDADIKRITKLPCIKNTWV